MHKLLAFLFCLLCAMNIVWGDTGGSEENPADSVTSNGELEKNAAESSLIRGDFLGLAPSAKKVYGVREGLSIAGYGEITYRNHEETNDLGQPAILQDSVRLDRANLYLGYRVNNKFILNSSVEFSRGDNVSMEFLYADYLVKEDFAVRAGLILLPMGLTNEFHEPNLFFVTHRPGSEIFIIPSSWREIGVGILGRKGIINYRLYAVNRVDAGGLLLFWANGLAATRQEGDANNIKGVALTGRLDLIPSENLLIGGSAYLGNAALRNPVYWKGASLLDPKILISIAEAHLEYRKGGFEFRSELAHASLGSDVVQLNELLRLSGDFAIGRYLIDGYVEVGYNFFRDTAGKRSLAPYLRYERIDAKNGRLKDSPVVSVGLFFQPVANLMVKTDYQFIDNAIDFDVNQFNLQLGYVF